MPTADAKKQKMEKPKKPFKPPPKTPGKDMPVPPPKVGPGEPPFQAKVPLPKRPPKGGPKLPPHPGHFEDHLNTMMLEAEKSGLLDGEEAKMYKEELQAHAARRAALNKRKREIKDRHEDLTSEAAQAEKDAMKDEMKKLQDEHREFLKKFGGPDKPFPPPPHPGMKDGDKPFPPPRIPKDKKKKPPSKEQLKKMTQAGVGDPGEKDVKEMGERIRGARKDMAQRRIDGLWESAQQAGFDEDELSAIREELDEFMAIEIETLESIEKIERADYPGEGDTKGPPKKWKPDSDLTDEQREARAAEKEKVRAVRRRQKQLEKRIREKSEL